MAGTGKARFDISIDQLDIFLTGDGNQTDIKVKHTESPLPNICLPNGPPPIWKGIEEQLLDHLGNVEALPIHDYKKQQRYVGREINVSNLVKVSTLPPTFELSVERDHKTGDLVGFTEEHKANAGGSATNSMSMLRAPDPESTIKGNTSNFPFWPGGLDLPMEEAIHSVTSEENTEDYKRVAPGLSKGLELSKPSSTDGQMKLSDLFIQDELFNFDSSSDEEDEKEVSAAISAETEEDCSDEIIETLTKTAKVITLTDTNTKAVQPQDTEYAVKLSATEPIEDFHQRVPDMAYKWPFELDIFQKQAVLCLENHENVFVAAHTSAGKTVVAEYAIALCRKHMTRAIYTSPIKALSNQKFRDFRQTFEEVGLITGDIQLNVDAPCLIMTTEILRSLLYGGSDVIRDVEWVIFDEVHYINDAERGVVWEEVIIMLPDHVNIILLSATVPNYMDFADWVGRTKKRKVFVISTTKRPVPLEHFLYTGNSTKTSNELFLLVDAESKQQDIGYKKALAAKKARASSHSQATGAKGPRTFGNSSSDKSVWLSVIEMLRKKDKLPAVAFTFSKKRIEENSYQLTSVDLTSSSEKSSIHVFIKKSIDRLKGSDKELPQVNYISNLLKRGIGVHHSGVLPILKEIVELLFQKGLIKVLFATETFAMGVNMPARTVLFDSIRKHDGTCLRDLKPTEYIQMAGRAGRRGLDSTGTVIILCKGDVPELSDLNRMMLGKMTTLESNFRLTYTMMLNLLRVERLKVQDMLKRSFSEFANRRDEVKNRDSVHDLRKKVNAINPIDCYYCSQDLEDFYVTNGRYQELREELHSKVVTHPQCVKYLAPGRVVLLSVSDLTAIGATMSTSNRGSRVYKCLVLTDKSEGWWKESLKVSNSSAVSSDGVDAAKGHIVIEVAPHQISTITTSDVNVPAPDKILENYSKRQIPRFRNDPASQSTLQLIASLSALKPEELIPVDPVKQFGLRDMDTVEQFMKLDELKSILDTYQCRQCGEFRQHLDSVSADMELREKLESLKYKLSDASLALLDEYNERLRVLFELHYIDKSDNVKLKGKVACEIKQQELLVTELVFQNIMEDMHHTEIAALLSCVVFEQKNCSQPNLCPSLKNGMRKIQEVAKELGEVQKKYMGDFQVQDYLAEFKFGLVEVVFQWARGMPFNEIIRLTDVQEGIIVRCIQRLDELLRDVKDAVRIIGNPVLGKKMEDASASIKRDIVFAASLYTS